MDYPPSEEEEEEEGERGQELAKECESENTQWSKERETEKQEAEC